MSFSFQTRFRRAAGDTLWLVACLDYFAGVAAAGRLASHALTSLSAYRTRRPSLMYRGACGVFRDLQAASVLSERSVSRDSSRGERKRSTIKPPEYTFGTRHKRHAGRIIPARRVCASPRSARWYTSRATAGRIISARRVCASPAVYKGIAAGFFAWFSA